MKVCQDNMKSFLQTDSESDCSGCGACIQICPKNCIVLTEHKDGFLYPKINNNICIHCNRCIIVCHYNNLVERHMPQISYVAKSSAETSRYNCSSGGVFYSLADCMLHHNGVIAGAMLDTDNICKHVIAKNHEELIPILGSKYVQSDTTKIFSEIKNLLNDGVLVLFSGTPCQVSGLKSYLQKEYDNLLTVDIACHGVPGQHDFMRCIEYIEKRYNGKISGLKFRDKKCAGWHHSISFDINRNNIIKKRYTLSPVQLSYYYLFLTARNHRLSCYSCPYVGKERVGDITLADFWGAEKYYTDKEIGSGMSAVLCNTPKGKIYFNEIKDKLETSEIKSEYIFQHNQPFVRCSPIPKNKDSYMTEILTDGYRCILRYISIYEYLTAKIKSLVPDRFKHYIKKKLKRIV